MQEKEHNRKFVPGTPPKYETAEELQKAIQDYFENGLTMRQVLTGKSDNKKIENIPVPTITGLCFYLGFESRQSFYDMEKRSVLSYTIKRARLFIEKEYEEQLQCGNTTGAIFALKNMGWVDKVEMEQVSYNVELSPEKAKEISDKLDEEV